MRFLLLATIVAALACRAEVITWTNSSDGYWNTAGNWSPNRVPTTNDIAMITNSGAYTVTLNADPTIAGLTVGSGNTGAQTLATAGNTLTLNGVADVTSNGVLVSSGVLSGAGPLRLSGALILGGAINTNLAVTIAPGGVMTLTSSGNQVKYLHGSVTNAGTMLWKMYGNFGISGTLHNLAGGLFEAQITNRSITRLSEAAIIINEGTFRKSSNTGDLQCGVHLQNSGIVETMIGTFTLSGGSSLQSGSTFMGAGQTRLDAGVHTLEGDLYATNLAFYGGATVAGAARLYGEINWLEGIISSGSAITVMPGSHLLLTSSGNNSKAILGSLTNAGTVTFSPYGNLTIGGIFHNLPGAIFDIRTTYNNISKTDPGARIINDGVVRRSSSSTTVLCGVPVINHGTVEALEGTLSITDTFANPNGVVALAGGTISLSSPLALSGGALVGWGTLNADVINAGCIRPSSSNGVLTIHGDFEQLLGGRFEFELAGNDPGVNQSRLHVTGAAVLRGTAGILWDPSYAPAIGTSFSVFTSDSQKGEFCCFDHFILRGQGLRLTPVYGSSAVTLLTVAAPEPERVPFLVTVDSAALACWPVEFQGYELYWSTNLMEADWRFLTATNRYLELPPLPREKFFLLRPQSSGL